MSVVYRSFWTDTGPDPLDHAKATMVDWLRSKGHVLDADSMVDGSVVEGKAGRVTSLEVGDGESRAFRSRLQENHQGQQWTTTLTSMQAGSDTTIWVDLEWATDDVFTRPPDFSSPRLARQLVEGDRASKGSHSLASTATLLATADLPGLVGSVFDADRALPIVVFAAAPGQYLDDLQERARVAAEVLCGVALVYAMPATATNDFNVNVGDELAVFGGAARYYLPGIDRKRPSGYRHRYIRRSIVDRHRRSAAQALSRELLSRSAAQRLPPLYRDVFKPLFEASSAGPDLVVDLTADPDPELQLRVEELNEDLLLTTWEWEEEQKRTAELARRVRFLEQCLREEGSTAAYEPTPTDSVPDTCDSCLEAVDLASTHFGGSLVLCDGATDDLDRLDGFREAVTWGTKAWQIFRALDAYASGKASGAINADFRTANESGALESFAVPKSWVAMHESDTTDKAKRYRDARTFPVPLDVDESGEVYMDAHFKLKQGGSPAPRIHFHDDTSGITGKVYIGWFGDHLTNKQTN